MPRPAEFLDQEVLPVLAQTLDSAFPEFGWVRRGGQWVATDTAFLEQHLGVSRVGRVVCKGDAPPGFVVHGGGGVTTWIEYVSGQAKPTGKDFVDAVRRLAELAGVDPTPLGGTPETGEQRAAREAARAEHIERIEELRAKRRVEEEADAKAKRDAAARIWREAAKAEGESIVAQYLASRGVDVQRTAVPRSLAFHQACPRGDGHLPAMVAIVTAGRTPVGVHRTYLSPEGGRVCDGQRKLTLGAVRGGVVRLTPRAGDRRGVLVLTEGIETGMAVVQACGPQTAVWACLSTAGLETVVIDEQDRQWVRVVVIAGDHDPVNEQRGERPGEGSARRAAERLRRELGVPVGVALPDGEDEGVDWLDVLNRGGQGEQAVLDAIVAAEHAATGPDRPDGPTDPPSVDTSGAGGGKSLPKNPLLIARAWLRANATPAGRGRRFRLAAWGDSWWWHDGRCYRETSKRVVASAVWDWLHDAMTEARGKVVPLDPSERLVEAVLKALHADTQVRSDVAPSWLPPVIEPDGGVRWGALASLDAPVRCDDDRVDAGNVVCYANGRLDVEAAAMGEVRLEPNTTDLFSSFALPYDLDVDALRSATGQDADPDAFAESLERLCPTWMRFVRECCEVTPDGTLDTEFMDCLQLMFGYSLLGDRSLEKVFLVQGLSGSGKGTIAAGLTACVGRDAVASFRFSDMNDRAWAVPLVGKKIAEMGDAHVTRNVDVGEVVEVWKLISGLNPVRVRDLYQTPRDVRLNTQIWCYVNTLPTELRDSSGALARRLVVLPMTKSFSERMDPDVKERIGQEGAGISLWALEGAMRLRRMKRPQIPLTTRGRIMLGEFVRATAPMQDFAEEHLVFGPGEFCVIGEVYERYKDWAQEAGVHPVARNKMLAQLQSFDAGVLSEKRQVEGVERRVYVGVRLAELHEDNPWGGPPPAPSHDSTDGLPI